MVLLSSCNVVKTVNIYKRYKRVLPSRQLKRLVKNLMVQNIQLIYISSCDRYEWGMNNNGFIFLFDIFSNDTKKIQYILHYIIYKVNMQLLFYHMQVCQHTAFIENCSPNIIFPISGSQMWTSRSLSTGKHKAADMVTLLNRVTD